MHYVHVCMYICLYTKVNSAIQWNLQIKDTLGTGINSADLFFVERLSPLGGSKCIVGIILEL